MIFLMRRFLHFVLVGSLAGMAAACAATAVPVPVVTVPQFPEFTQPPVPSALAGSPAILGHDRAWRFLQAGDLRNAEREIGAATKLVPGFYPAEASRGYLNLARKDPRAALGAFDRALELQ